MASSEKVSQPAVAIEGRVLDGFGGDRRAQLLEARGGGRPAGRIGEQAQHRIDRPAVGSQAGLERAIGRSLQDRAIGVGQDAVRTVGAIDWKVRQEFGQHAAQGGMGQLAIRERRRTGVELG